jgi:O-methyltransferase
MLTSLRRFGHRALSAKFRAKFWPNGGLLSYPAGITDSEIALFERVQPYTMTSLECVVTLSHAVAYVIDNDIPGALVECGVWRGGNLIVMAETIRALGASGRRVVGFDTFEGMTEPTDRDVSRDGEAARDLAPEGRPWCEASIDEVTAILNGQTRYEHIDLVQGRVEDTVPLAAPPSISLLRLDTDWYDSTIHELEHLYPRLSTGGVLIIDDYGYWQGQRQAVDEYFARTRPRPLLLRIDHGARIAVKP